MTTNVFREAAERFASQCLDLEASSLRRGYNTFHKAIRPMTPKNAASRMVVSNSTGLSFLVKHSIRNEGVLYVSSLVIPAGIKRESRFATLVQMNPR